MPWPFRRLWHQARSLNGEIGEIKVEPIVEMPEMAAYGVDPTTWSGLPWSWASERLVANRNYWVVTVSPEGQPHSLPVWGAWLTGRHVFVFSCAHSSAKLRHLVANPRVSITGSDTVECISVQGRATVLGPDDSDVDVFIGDCVAKYGAEVPGDLAEFLRAGAVVRVQPTVAFGVIEREDEFATRATRWRF